MITKSAEELLVTLTHTLTTAGASDSNAKRVVEHMVEASLHGVDSHGIMQVVRYVEDILLKRVDPCAQPEVLKDEEAYALVSGRWTYGQVGAYETMRIAIAKAKVSGVALASLVEAAHIGRVGHYVEMASREQLVSMVFGGGYCQTNPRSTPYGGRSGALDTHPIAMGFAGPDPKAPIMFDFATTAKSGGNMDIVRRRGGSYPEGWAVDDKGDPTTDPEVFFDGGYFVPFGGHKGYCLMMAAEVLGNVLSGADNYANEGPDYPVFNHQGVTMITMKADLFRPLDQFKATLKEREERIRNVSPAAGHEEVLVPGDPERRAYVERSKSGIPIHEDDWKLIVEAAASVGCKID